MNEIWNLIKRFKDLSTIGFANLISNAISGIFWFYLASLLGTTHYGEVSYFIAIAGIASVVSFLGTGNTLLIYTAKGEKIQAPIFFIAIIASIISSIVLFIMFANFGVSLYIIGYTIFGLATAEILGRKLYKDYSKYMITQKILFVGLALGFYFLLGPNGVIVGFAVSFFPYVSRIYKGFKESKLDFSVLKSHKGFMINSYVLDLSRTFSGNTDKLFIAPMLGFALLGNYQLGTQFLSLLSLIPSVVYQYTLPHDASGNPNKILKKITIIVSIILAILGVFLAPKILPMIFPKFTEATRIIQIVSLAIIPLTINLMYISRFLGTEKSKVVLVGSGIYILVQISAIVILGKIYGINGVAGALVLAATSEAIYLISADRYFKRGLNTHEKLEPGPEINSENYTLNSTQFIVNISNMEPIEKKLNILFRNPFFSLFTIGIIAIFLRLYFFPWKLPVTLDAYEYFRYAIDTNILGHLPTINTISNNGWPIILSFIFKIFHFNNFLEYMNLQRFISIIISVSTLVPVYFLCRKFFDKSYAILGSALFVLEPHIIQNSLLGITDPLFILLITTSLALFFRNEEKITWISFAIVAFATMIRTEGFGVLLALSILFFIRNRSKKNIISYLFSICIFVLLLLPISITRIETVGNDALISRLTTATDELTIYGGNIGSPHNIISSLEMLVRFLFSSLIPTFILFVPIGIYLIFKEKKKKDLTIIIIIACMIPAIFYAYFELAEDVRFIFPLFPFFSILSVIAIKEIGQRFKVKNTLMIIIIIGIIITSFAFLTLKINNEHEKEAFTLSHYVANYTTGINPYPPESKYLLVTGVTNTNFPTLSTSLSEGPKQIATEGFSTLEAYIQYGKDHGLTHLVIDNSNNRPSFFADILNHDDHFPYLIKIFDSADYGFKYHLKIYKIDYSKFQMIEK